MTTNGTSCVIHVTTNGTRMTPALIRCREAHRKLCERLGRPPTVGELALEQGGIRKQSAAGLVVRLAAMGQRLPMSRATARTEVVSLLCLADRILSRYADPEDTEWATFRRQGAKYLEGQAALTGTGARYKP